MRYFKRKLLLRQVAESDYQCGGTYLAYGRVEVESVYKKFHQGIVQQYADAYQYEIAEQLHAAAEVRVRKYYVFAQQEPGGEGNGHRHEQGRDVGADVNDRGYHHLLM